MTGESSRGLVGSMKPTTEEIRYAAKTIASALETIGVTKFGIIGGGGAVTLLGSQYNL